MYADLLWDVTPHPSLKLWSTSCRNWNPYQEEEHALWPPSPRETKLFVPAPELALVLLPQIESWWMRTKLDSFSTFQVSTLLNSLPMESVYQDWSLVHFDGWASGHRAAEWQRTTKPNSLEPSLEGLDTLVLQRYGMNTETWVRWKPLHPGLRSNTLFLLLPVRGRHSQWVQSAPTGDDHACSTPMQLIHRTKLSWYLIVWWALQDKQIPNKMLRNSGYTLYSFRGMPSRGDIVPIRTEIVAHVLQTCVPHSIDIRRSVEFHWKGISIIGHQHKVEYVLHNFISLGCRFACLFHIQQMLHVCYHYFLQYVMLLTAITLILHLLILVSL